MAVWPVQQFSNTQASNTLQDEVSGAGSASLPSASPAAAGTNQATGTVLAAGFNVVTAADGTKGVTLPVAVPNMKVKIKNSSASALLVYANASPASVFINAVASGTAYSMAAQTSATFTAFSATQWYSEPLVAS